MHVHAMSMHDCTGLYCIVLSVRESTVSPDHDRASKTRDTLHVRARHGIGTSCARLGSDAKDSATRQRRPPYHRHHVATT